MPALKRLAGSNGQAAPHVLVGSPCECLAEFYRQEILKHHRCLEAQREYFSDVAINQAEQALMRILEQVEGLCQRDDACQVIGELLKKFDTVTRLSAWTEPQHLN
jgi:hypothetical protein